MLADDHPIFLEGLSKLLEMADDFEVVGVATTGHAALRLIGETKPDVAVLDVSMPELSGIALSRRLAADNSGVRILLLTLHEDRAYLNQALQAGADGRPDFRRMLTNAGTPMPAPGRSAVPIQRYL